MVTVFRELRSGVTEDGRTKVKSPSGTLSTAEAISVVTSGLALAGALRRRGARAADVAAGIVGAVVKDPVADSVGLDRVPRGGRPRAPRLGGLLPRLPRGQRVTAAVADAHRRGGGRHYVLGVRHHGPGSARGVRRRARPARARRGADRGTGRRGPAGRASSRPTAWRRRSRCSPTPPTRRARAVVLAVRGLLPRVAGAARGRRDHGAPARFSDLPVGSGAASARPGRPAAPDGAERAPATRRRRPTRRSSPVVRCATRSPLLAAAAGYDDPERWWDDVIESRLGRFGRRSRRSPRRWPSCARTGPPRHTHRERGPRGPARGATCGRCCARRAEGQATARSPSSAAPGTRRRWPARCPPRRPTRALLRGVPQAEDRADLGAVDALAAGRTRPATARGSTSPGWYHHLFTAPDRTPSPGG